MSEDKERKQRLAERWRAGAIKEFSEIAVLELRPRIIADVLSRGATRPDAEDAFAEVLTKMLKVKSQMDDPQAYLWRGVINETITRYRQRRAESAVAIRDEEDLAPNGRDGCEGGSVRFEFSDDALLVVFEALVETEDAEVSMSSMRSVIRTALTRLTAGQRRLIELLLTEGVDIGADDGARRLGLKSGSNFRVYKKRALEALRVHLRSLASSVDVDLDEGRATFNVFFATWRGPNPEDDPGAG